VTLNGMVGRRSSPASGPPSSDGGRELYCPRQPKLPMIDLRLTSQRWRVDLGFTFKQLVVPPGSANCPLSRWVGASSCPDTLWTNYSPVVHAGTRHAHDRPALCMPKTSSGPIDLDFCCRDTDDEDGAWHSPSSTLLSSVRSNWFGSRGVSNRTSPSKSSCFATRLRSCEDRWRVRHFGPWTEQSSLDWAGSCRLLAEDGSLSSPRPCCDDIEIWCDGSGPTRTAGLDDRRSQWARSQ
jgi:hypothetical protein